MLDSKYDNFLEIQDEDMLLTAGMGLRDISKEYMQEHVRKWIITREYYLGNQYLRSVGDKIESRVRRPGDQWRPRTTRNIITQTIDPVWAIIAGARPLTNIDACFPDSPVLFRDPQAQGQQNYQPLNLNGQETAERGTQLLDDIWDSVHRKEPHAAAMVILESLLAGTGFRAYGITEHPFRGTEISVTHLQPDQIYLDPDGRDLITFKDFRYMILKFNMSVATIKDSWKGVTERDYGTADNMTRFDPDTERSLFSKIFRGKGPPRQEEEVSEWSLRKYPVYFLYYAGHNPELIPSREDADKRYPNGRLVIWINDKKVVHDGDVRTRGFTFPVVGFTPNPVPHLAYGYSEAEKLLGYQDLINSFSNVVASNVILNGHTQLLVESGAIDRRNWSVSPGAILTVMKDALRSGRIQQLFPGPIGAEIVQYMMNIERLAKEETGDADGLMRGAGGTTSGIHARTLQESMFVRHAFRIGLLDYSYEQCAYKEFSMMQQFLPLDNNYYKGYHQLDEEMALAIQNLLFKVKLESRKDLPFSGAEQMNMYFLLAQQGFLTIEEFYELTKIPISQEWKEKCKKASEMAKPGIPLQLQAQMELKEDMAVAEQGNLADSQLRQTNEPDGRSQSASVSGGGGGQQNTIPTVPGVPQL